MPVIKSAKKKLRQDKKRQVANKKVKETLLRLIKKAKKDKKEASIRLATQALDKAAKKGIIHKNKASRVKSRLSILQPKTEKKVEKKPHTKKV